ncbi:alpha/beta hydrolase fold domain-containing protein [Kushneria aurantia]|uniref:Alpha/beta hydrolase fold domain-containing protein n=1 Tax=Kushneria aurantia TaxID=504092 RepID=A0ABV6FZR0_9GAMM|nr:alpha/beta hydrolase fold domain-containing protein [Kushneria aurantia]
MDVETFIEHLCDPADAVDNSLALRRERYEQLHRRFRPSGPSAVEVVDSRVAGVAVRRFCPVGCPAGGVVYLHGGGWNLGSVESHHGITLDLAVRLNREVVSVDYRRLPEVGYATALQDCRRVVSDLDPLAIAGDSAGGRLAIDVACTGFWRGVLGLVYPLVGTPSTTTLGDDAPLLTRREVLTLWETVCDEVPAFPAERPPAEAIEVLAVEHDPLTPSIERAVALWRCASAAVGYRCAPNMVHSSLHAHAELAEMNAAWQDFCHSLGRRLGDK